MIRFFLKELIAEKEFNEKRRITFDEVAKETGIGRNTLSRIANVHGYNSSTDAVDKLCQYFECDIAKMIEHIKQEESDN